MRPKILLIESNIISRFEFRKLLNQLECDVTPVVNGYLAIEAVEREEFDIVIMNPNMPMFNGAVITKRLRGLKSKTELPILAMVKGYDLRLGYDYALAGVNDLLYLPASLKSMTEILAKWMPVFRSTQSQGYLKTGTN